MPPGIILKVDVTDLQCKFCHESLRDITSLADHLIAIHGQPIEKQYGLGIMSFQLLNQKTFKCVHCERTCETFGSLNCHMNCHYPNVACPKCNKYFADNQRMKGHLFKRHKLEKKTDERDNALILLKYSNMCPFKYRFAYLCYYCAFSASDIGALREHIAEHTNKNLKNKLPRNVFLKADITNLRCELCFEHVKDISSLVDHLINIHNQPIKKNYGTGIMTFLLSGSGPYKCTHCDLTFKHYLKINSHMNSHYANSICSACGQSFADPHKLKTHTKKVHSNNPTKQLRISNSGDKTNVETKKCEMIRAFKCRFCNDILPSNLARIKHIKVKHLMTRDYPCSMCPLVFKRSTERTMHVRSFHMSIKPFACDDCPYQGVTKKMLQNHIKTHIGSI